MGEAIAERTWWICRKTDTNNGEGDNRQGQCSNYTERNCKTTQESPETKKVGGFKGRRVVHWIKKGGRKLVKNRGGKSK